MRNKFQQSSVSYSGHVENGFTDVNRRCARSVMLDVDLRPIILRVSSIASMRSIMVLGILDLEVKGGGDLCVVICDLNDVGFVFKQCPDQSSIGMFELLILQCA